MTLLEKMDKANLKKILLVVISVLTLAALALLLVIIVMSIAPKDNADTTVNYTEITISEKQFSMGTLILADNAHPFTAGTDLTSTMINCQQYRNENRGEVENGPYYSMNNVQLSTISVNAAHNFLVDAEAAIKEDNLLIKYGFNGDDGVTVEYATGMLMFLTDYDENLLPESYAAWLDAHAAEYGFVESFNNAYRYVGIEHAKYMTENSLSLADYISSLKANNTSYGKALSITLGNELYKVYYVECNAGDVIKVPDDSDYTVSGTNEGGVIITVKTAK